MSIGNKIRASAAALFVAVPRNRGSVTVNGALLP